MAGIVQQAFTVQDLDASIRDYVTLHGIGPWFVRGPFVPTSATYRGRPTAPRLTLARAFSGDLMIELVQQHDDTPSVFREQIERDGYGFHHWGFVTDDFDGDLRHYEDEGMLVAFADQSSTGARIAYVDTSSRLPGMTELIESTDVQERLYAAMKDAAVGWTGDDPVRADGSLGIS
ncbi:MAG TPA: VOC family protein [Microbacterium sp.]|uniref:VOC family protein n=1 Tax=Microbacterium sp. TaxID=51671 RepID=UPI002B4A7CD2|nr:VOC family protein [Microbacterium sp.]HKT58170.1 VOC family protein [Microbacterium sp.]